MVAINAWHGAELVEEVCLNSPPMPLRVEPGRLRGEAERRWGRNDPSHLHQTVR